MATSAPSRSGDRRPDGESVAAVLVDIGAIGIGHDDQFTFASGLKSPVYCDNRLLLSRVSERERVVQQLVDRMQQECSGWDAVAGVASAGIPFAAWVAEHFHIPMAYIRPAAKDHGAMKRVEGGLEAGKQVLLVEDLVTTGESALSAIEALRDSGLHCSDCFSIVDYGFKVAATRFAEANVKLHTLVDTPAILAAAGSSARFTADDVNRVRAWHARVNETGV